MNHLYLLFLLILPLLSSNDSAVTSNPTTTVISRLSRQEVRSMFMTQEVSNWCSSEHSLNSSSGWIEILDILVSAFKAKQIESYTNNYGVIKVVITNNTSEPISIMRSSYKEPFTHALTSPNSLIKKYPNFTARKWMLRILTILLPIILGGGTSWIILNSHLCQENALWLLAPPVLSSLPAIVTFLNSRTAASLASRLNELKKLSPVIIAANKSTSKIHKDSEVVIIPPHGTLTDLLVVKNNKL